MSSCAIVTIMQVMVRRWIMCCWMAIPCPAACKHLLSVYPIDSHLLCVRKDMYQAAFPQQCPQGKMCENGTSSV